MNRLGVVEGKPIVATDLAYDEPDTGQVTILIGHQWVSIKKIEKNLLCPMQILMNDVIVNDQPKSLTDNMTEEDHAIISPGNDRYRIPLYLQGVTYYFTTWKPTIEEFETCPRIDLKYMSPE